MSDRLFSLITRISLAFACLSLSIASCGTPQVNSQLATWASHSYECPEDSELVTIKDPAPGRWCEKEGAKHGREVWHHKNQVKAAEILWVEGKKHRLERWWRPEGLKHLQISWADGLKHGLEIRWTQKGGFGQATCFLSNKLVWSTTNVVEAQTRTCITPETLAAQDKSPEKTAEPDGEAKEPEEKTEGETAPKEETGEEKPAEPSAP